MVLGPSQKITLQFGDIDFDEFRLIQEGKNQVYFVALIKYEDTVSSPSRIHQTQLSRQFFADSEGGFSFGNLPTHNCADDDCPK
jgi:hypothetical protein